MTDREIFIKAKELIETRGWRQGPDELRVDPMVTNGKPLCISDAVDVSLRLFGVTWFAYGHEIGAHLKLRSLFGAQFSAGVANWNDAPGRTKEEVLAKLDELIAAEPLV